MYNISVKKFVLFGLFPILVGCETLNHQTLTEQYNEPFFTYYLPTSTSEKPVMINPTAITTEFKYEDGCLLAFDGSRWMTPVFPEGHATFNSHHKTLRLLGTSYKMGNVISAAGYVHTYNSEKVKNYSNSPAEKCITEYLATYYGDYEKIDLDKN
ncbi:MAG: hypothetical protein KA291_00990 [Psychrobacter sp.]|nr:hypothetical protein [Psychrobacter sp.]